MRHFLRTLRDYAAFRRVFESTPARHKEPSIIVSADDELPRPTKRLLDVALGAVGRARGVEFHTLARRTSAEPRWHEVWPGEHYKLLAGLVAELGARNVVEIGTSTVWVLLRSRRRCRRTARSRPSTSRPGADFKKLG